MSYNAKRTSDLLVFFVHCMNNKKKHNLQNTEWPFSCIFMLNLLPFLCNNIQYKYATRLIYTSKIFKLKRYYKTIIGEMTMLSIKNFTKI